jgi:cell division protein ZapA (FtsZ GTPase activity inhibitor)
MEKRQLKIELLGTSFTVQSGESAEHLARVSRLLGLKVEEVKARYTFADPLTVALLAALNLADELVKEREGAGKPGSDEEFDGLARKIMDGLDDTLLSHAPFEGAGPEDPPHT